jgi:hypothetical protein
MFHSCLRLGEVDPITNSHLVVHLVDLSIFRTKSAEPPDRDVPGRGQNMGPLRWMLALMLAKLSVGGACRLLRDEADSGSPKSVGERHGRLQDSQSKRAGTHQLATLPFGRPVGVTLGLRQDPVGTHKSWHRITGSLDVRCIHPEVCRLGHTPMLAHERT